MRAFETLSDADFHHRLERTPGVAVVLFTGPDCGACRHLEAVLPGALADAALFRVDVQRDTGLARAFEIFHLPAVLVFVDGRYHAPLATEPTPARLRAALAGVLAAPPQEEP